MTQLMNRTWLIARRLLRWGATGFSLFLAAMVIFLGGYWIGWKAEPKTGPFDSPAGNNTSVGLSTNRKPPAQTASVTASISGSASIEETKEPVEDQVVRLAKALTTARDSRLGKARVAVEISTLSLGDVWAALERLHSAPDSAEVAELRAKLLLRWAALDPAGAFDYWRASIKSLRWPDSLNYQFFERWARVDAMRALDGWKTLVADNAIPEYEQGYPLRRIFARMAAQDFDLAVQQARAIDGEHRQEALRGLGELAYRPESRTQLLNELSAWPPDEVRNQILAAALTSWARTGELDQAMTWLDQAGLDEATRFGIVEDIGMHRFHEHYQEGADWLLAQTRTPAQRANVLADIVVNWAQYDVVEAGEWLLAQGLDESASRAMQAYTTKLATDFPEQALLWALRVPDNARREAALARVEQRLKDLHPNRAEELLRVLDTPE